MSRLTFLATLITLTFTGVLLASGVKSQNLKNIRLSIRAQNALLSQVLDELQEKSNLSFAYSEETGRIPNVSLAATNETLEAVLQQLTRQKNLRFNQTGSLIAIVQVPPPPKPGKISGKVIDEKGESLPGATIKVLGVNRTLQSAIDGSYEISLPPGTYTLEVSYVSFQSKRVSEVIVREDQVTRLDVTLNAATGNLKEVVIQSSYKRESVNSLYAQQKNNASMTDGISAEQIARTPDNNVAQVLRRVSGLTLQDNKYVVVRGMSERYNNVLLNGSSLPSTEPNRRNFSFDLVPSSLIDNVVVNKTASPDLPGEFTGGLVQINTKDIPDENFIQFTAGSGFNTNTTGKDFISTRRLSSDYWGTAGNGRTWLGKTWDSQPYREALLANNISAVNRFNTGIPNNYGLYTYRAKPLQQYQFNAGHSFPLKNGNTIGLIVSGTYRHEENKENYDALFRAGPVAVSNAGVYNFTTALGAIANVSWQNAGNKVTLRNLFNRRFSHENIIQTALNYGGNADIPQEEYISTVEAGDLLQSRLEGRHVLFGKIKVNWFGDFADVRKKQPDTRYSRSNIITALDGTPIYGVTYDQQPSATIADGGLFAYNLKEQRKGLGGDISIPFQFLRSPQQFKLGYAGTFRTSGYEQVMLSPSYYAEAGKRTELDAVAYGQPDYKVFVPENFATGLLYYRPVTATGIQSGDYYDGRQDLNAAYAMADLKVLKSLRLIGGVRMEDNKMDVRTYTRVNTTTQSRGVDSLITYKERDFLPSVNVIWSVTPKFNVRAAASRTLARPDFKERSTFRYYDFRYRQAVYGTSGLSYTRTNNYDVRLEWYPAPGEVIAISGYHKKFDKPVEVVSNRQPDGKYTLYYYNLIDAKNTGVELDLRKSLSFVRAGSVFWKNMYVSANGSVLKSAIRYDNLNLRRVQAGLPPVAINPDSVYTRNRPLQGLSPYIINAGINYLGAKWGFNVTYNRFGRRVLFGGVDDYDDTYEQPRDQIDLQLSARLLKQRMEIKWNASDLLNQQFVQYLNRSVFVPGSGAQTDNVSDPEGFGYNRASDYQLKSAKRGVNYSFTISYLIK